VLQPFRTIKKELERIAGTIPYLDDIMAPLTAAPPSVSETHNKN
jgi:hypothetical protein